MRRIYQSIPLALLWCFCTFSAHADMEAVSSTIKGTVSKAQTEYKKVQDAASAADDLKNTVTQGVNGIKSNIEEIADVVKDPLSMVTTTVLGGMQDKVDGSATDDEGIDNVKETYNRTFGEENNITKAKQLRAALNKEQGENLARLYARALILRQELAEEKDADVSLDTISGALEANSSIQIQSLKRWNKILEMQAYINGYKNTMAIQNFVNEDNGKGDKNE